MMTAKEKIIELMKIKGILLSEYSVIGRYFDDKDLENILLWDDLVCNYVWGALEIVLIMIYDGYEPEYANDSHLCPFCIKNGLHLLIDNDTEEYISCRNCEYGVNHRICTKESGSDFRDIINNLRDNHDIDSMTDLLRLNIGRATELLLR